MNYFNPEQDPMLYKCPCGHCNVVVNPELPRVLNLVRERAGTPMVVTSGPRCPQYNIAIGGATYSEHVDGDGADIVCTSSRSRFLIIRAAIEVGINRIGVDDIFLHLGISKTNDQLVMWVY